MAKHKFLSAFQNENGVVAVLCATCGLIVTAVNGKAPREAREDESCKSEDFSQAAARVVTEATKGD